MTPITFYFDVGSPYAYLAAERLERVLPGAVSWQPVLLGGLFKLTGRSSWALGDYERRQRGMAEIERRAREYGVAPIRWPDPWPTNYLTAMRAVTYAFSAGRGPQLSIALFRAAFEHGHELSNPAHVFATGAEVGFARGELEQAVAAPETKLALREATDAAYARGVFGVPTVAIGDELFWGDDRLQDAAGLLLSRGATA
jgi:2-hydroxychromene-2-carboxylate isomerase